MRHIYALAILATLTAAVYAPVRHAEFVYEDAGAILNPAVRGEQPIAVDRARWLSLLSHRIVYRVFGAGPAPAHLVNLGLHLVNGALVYRLSLLVVSPWAAVVAAGVFWLHPIQSEAVAYAASRSELLSTCFALLALLMAANAGRARSWLAACGLLALAVCAKESTVVVVPLLLWLAFVRDCRVPAWTVAVLVVPCLAMAASVLWFDFTQRTELGPLQFAATQAAAVWRYVALMLTPVGQTIDHDFDFVPMSLRYVALAAFVGAGGVLLLSSLSARADTGRAYRPWDDVPYLRVTAFGAIWAIVALAPRFVVMTPEFLNEHQLYFPLVGLSMTLGAVLAGDRT